MWRRRKEKDFSAEIEAHLELERDELVEEGMEPHEARDAAHRKLGNRTRVEESFYEGTRWVWLDHLWHDARLSVRALLRSPGFTIAVVATLALAIGASTAIFSVADEALFRPLPLPEADQLTAVYNYDEKTGAYLDSSYPDYADYRDHARSFEQISAYVRYPLAASIGEETLRTSVEAVTPEYFSMLRLTPLIGAGFTAADAPEALLSERLWRERFGADPGVLGSTVRIERQPFTVVGVIPRQYRGVNLSWSEPPDVWIPLAALSIAVPRLEQMKILSLRPARWLVIIGRRKAGVTVEQAQAELRSGAANIASLDPANKDISAVAFEASRSKFWPAFREKVALSFSVFGIATALVLLLACANVSNLLLERALARRREVAVQMALGASRRRLIRQMMVESFLLVMPAFPGALLVSGLLVRLLALYPSAIGGVALSLEVRTDARVFFFAFLLSSMAVALFGTLLALQATRSTPCLIIKESGNSLTSGKKQWLRESMVVVQIAFTTVLLVGGSMFARSLLRGYAIDPGFRSDHLIVSTFDINALPASSRGAFIRRLLDESSALPGVESAAVSSHFPLISGAGTAEVSASTFRQTASLRYAGAGFFATMGIPLREGREFAVNDRLTNVAIVTEDLAMRLWPDASPIGRRLLLRRPRLPDAELEVIGVVRTVRAASVWNEPEPHLYVPSETATLFWILRTRGNPTRQLQEVRQFWSRMTTETPLWDLRTGDDIMAETLAPQRVAVGLFGAFGLLAITLASLGLYSLTAFSVARRTREIGIRIAVGARPEVVVGRILGRGLLLAILGIVTGSVVGVKLGQLASPLIRGVSPNDAVSFLVIAVFLSGVSALATLVPASRAARVDPVVALRSE